MSFLIETERLYIRELLPEDVEGMFELDSDLEVHKYIGRKPIKTKEEAANMIQFIRDQYVENGIGRWAVIEKEQDSFLGWLGFKLMKEIANGHINHYDFGYRLVRRAWGRGIATEASKAAMHYGIEQLQLNPIFAMTDVNNAASRRVLEKLGFRFETIFNYDGPSPWRDEDIMATWYVWPGNKNDTPGI